MINKLTIIGHVGRDPELKFLESGRAVCTFSVATTEKWKDRESGEQKEDTQWHKVVAWGPLAETCAKYLSKGRQVYVEGKLTTRSYEKDGVKKYVTEIVAREVKFLGGQNSDRPRADAPAPEEPGGGGPDGGGPDGGYVDDEIPFIDAYDRSAFKNLL